MSNNRLLEIHEELQDSLAVPVKIGWKEVLRVVVDDLMKKRKNSKGENREAFDRVLRCYLGDEDFEKYVINGEKTD